MPVPGWFVSVSPLDRSAGGVIQLRVSARQHDGAFVRAAIRRDSEAHGHGLPDSSFPGHTGIVRVLDTPPQPTWRCEARSEEHTSGLQSLMRISYAVFCLKKKSKP